MRCRRVAPPRCCAEVSRRRERLDAELRRRWPGKVRRGGALLLKDVESSGRPEKSLRAGKSTFACEKGGTSPRVFAALEKGAAP